MAEYINKQDLLEKVREQQNNIFGVPCIIAEIEDAETVEIVRCRDCVHYCLDDFQEIDESHWCELSREQNEYPKPDDFCSYGERGDT